MTTFLCIRLHGPLASWGDTAVAGRRPSTPQVSRSGALGLLAAALGVRRDDGDAWAALDAGVGIASRTDFLGELLVDYHTAQGPSEALLRAARKRAHAAGRPWARPATRREELAFRSSELDTELSARQYRTDALWTVAFWVRDDAVVPWTLGRCRDALRAPSFVLYLGRKSCPLDIPMEPQLVEAVDPVAAMAGASFATDDLLAPVAGRRAVRGNVHWEGDWPGLTPAQSVLRRDRVSSRARWQFTDRMEHQAPWSPEPKEDGDVPQQG